MILALRLAVDIQLLDPRADPPGLPFLQIMATRRRWGRSGVRNLPLLVSRGFAEQVHLMIHRAYLSIGHFMKCMPG